MVAGRLANRFRQRDAADRVRAGAVADDADGTNPRRRFRRSPVQATLNGRPTVIAC